MSEQMGRLYTKLNSLAIFRPLLTDSVVACLYDYLGSMETGSTAKAVGKYAQFVAAFYQSGAQTLAAHILNLATDCENSYIKLLGQGLSIPPEMVYCLAEELGILQEVADLRQNTLREPLDWKGYLPDFPNEYLNITRAYRQRCKDISRRGYGIYAKYHMFYLGEGQQIIPVQSPDKTRLSELIDYKREQKIILDNTLAMLEGKPAANILLSGDAGTGKSSTVKAIVNELKDQGLRILEVRKNQLHSIPKVLDELSQNPLKFILFIDDLSFQKDDDNFSTLKAILEGSVSAKTANVVIYATSNRRHLVKESFSSRDGDDVHRNDTMQELLSLSERFGLQVTFQKPDKATYLDIVHHLAEGKGLRMEKEELEMLAERYALSRGGRSARAARQFVDGLISRPQEF